MALYFVTFVPLRSGDEPKPPHEGRVVGRIERWEDPLDDVAAGGAEVGDHARAGRIAEAVVVHDDGGFLPVQLLDREIANARVPLDSVAVEAEEVRRLDDGGRIPRTGRAVDERLRRMSLRVVGYRDGLVSGKRPDHDVSAELLHQALRLLDRRVRPVVRAADPN